MHIRIALALIAGLSASLALAQDRQPERLRALTPEGVADQAAIKDDSLEVEATITTEPAFAEKHGLLGTVWNDGFVRAFVNKKTGGAKYQIYQRLFYLARSYHDFDRANYETPGGGDPQSVELVALGRSIVRRGSQLIGCCIREEDVAFGIDEAFLRTVAAQSWTQPDTGPIRVWKFRFKSHAGIDADDYLAPAEVAGALLAVDRYRTAHGLRRP